MYPCFSILSYLMPVGLQCCYTERNNNHHKFNTYNIMTYIYIFYNPNLDTELSLKPHITIPVFYNELSHTIVIIKQEKTD